MSRKTLRPPGFRLDRVVFHFSFSVFSLSAFSHKSHQKAGDMQARLG